MASAHCVQQAAECAEATNASVLRTLPSATSLVWISRTTRRTAADAAIHVRAESAQTINAPVPRGKRTAAELAGIFRMTRATAANAAIVVRAGLVPVVLARAEVVASAPEIRLFLARLTCLTTRGTAARQAPSAVTTATVFGPGAVLPEPFAALMDYACNELIGRVPHSSRVPHSFASFANEWEKVRTESYAEGFRTGTNRDRDRYAGCPTQASFAWVGMGWT